MIPGRARSWRKRVLAMGERGPSRRLGTVWSFDKASVWVLDAPLVLGAAAVGARMSREEETMVWGLL